MKTLGIFKENTRYKAFFLSLLFSAIGFGLYKGVMDNYLAEIVKINQVDRGLTEFFRELPGLLLVLLLALFYKASAEKMYRMGIVIMVIGMGIIAIVPPIKMVIILSIFFYSLGEHIQLGMKNTLSLEYSRAGFGGQALGYQSAIYQIGNLLEVFYGARKQVFFTFGPYVLILFYGADAGVISLLFAVSAVACFIFSPLVGKLIDKVGYKPVMIGDTLILVIVCFFYGFAHHIFPMHTAFIICCVNYVLDSVISLASMASNVYVQDISDSPEEMRATISTGISVNHLITIFIALLGGWIWKVLGIETLFILSAVLGLANSAYAATIKVRKV